MAIVAEAAGDCGLFGRKSLILWMNCLSLCAFWTQRFPIRPATRVVTAGATPAICSLLQSAPDLKPAKRPPANSNRLCKLSQVGHQNGSPSAM